MRLLDATVNDNNFLPKHEFVDQKLKYVTPILSKVVVRLNDRVKYHPNLDIKLAF